MTPREFGIDLGKRAIATAAQVAIAYFATAQVIGDVNFAHLGLAVAMALVVVTLKALTTINVTITNPVVDVLERVVATAAQTALGMIGAAALLTEVDWVMIGSASLVAAAITLLTHVGQLASVGIPTEQVGTGDAGGH